jgi:hypothetical protein
MRTLMFALAAVAPLAIVTPAAAQDVGVRVGPLEFGAWRVRSPLRKSRLLFEAIAARGMFLRRMRY